MSYQIEIYERFPKANATTLFVYACSEVDSLRAENKALRELLHTAANSIGGFIEECELLDNRIAKARVVAGKRILATVVQHLAQSEPGAGKEGET